MRAQTKIGGIAMKLLTIRWLVLISLVGAVFAGVLTSNVGCGGSDNNAKAGSGGSSGGGTSGGGTGGGGVTLKFSNTFDTDKQGWVLSQYVDSNYFNWGATTDPDSGVGLDGGMAPSLDWSSADGDPNPGSLKVTVTFSGFKQYIDPKVNISTPIDLTGRIVKARARLVSGSFPSGGVQFHISSGLTGPNAYCYVAAQFVNSTSFTVGNWITLQLDTSTVSSASGTCTFDASQIVEMGVQFTTGDPYEGGTPAFGQAVFEIDSIQG
jgi:hypothetical protein